MYSKQIHNKTPNGLSCQWIICKLHALAGNALPEDALPRMPSLRMPSLSETKSVPAQVHPTLEALEDVMANLYQAVDSRVYVSVGRGLWDCSSQDVYEYLEGLQEGLDTVQSIVYIWLFCIVSFGRCASD